MKYLKRLILMLAITTMLICALSVSAAAAMTVSAGDAEAYAGETVTVPVKMSSNAGFVSASIYVEFDESALTLTGVQDMSLIDGTAHTTRFTSPYILSWENDTKTSNYISNGTLAELVFTVSSFAEPGDYDITISIPTHGILNSDGSEVDCSVEAGAITVLTEECSHEWGDWKKSSSTRHKRSCDLCGEVEYDSHDWDDGEVTEEATEDTTGVLTYTCDVCGATKTEIIPEIPSENISVTGITLSKSTTTMTVGSTLTLTATVTPADAANPSVTWTSTNTAVAKVSGGTVTAISAGTVVITATTTDGGYTASCTVTVELAEVEIPEDAPVITVANVTGRAGNTVDVTISIENNTGITGAIFRVNYDSALTLTNVVTGDAFASLTMADLAVPYLNPLVLSWDGDGNDSSNGTLVTLTFTIPEGMEVGDYPIVIAYDTDDIYDSDLNDVAIAVVNGQITVTDIVYGDYNNDGKINGKDLTLIRRYISGGFDLSGYDAAAADVNLDGKVNGKDLTLIRRYISGGFDIVLGQ